MIETALAAGGEIVEGKMSREVAGQAREGAGAAASNGGDESVCFSYFRVENILLLEDDPSLLSPIHYRG
jgi:hypothetical protein